MILNWFGRFIDSRRLRKHSLILFSLTFMLKWVSFLKEAIVANYYGTSIFKDGFVALIMILTIAYQPIVQSFIMIVPKSLKEKEYHSQFILFFMGIFFCFQLIVSAFLYIFFPNIIDFVYQGMDPASLLVAKQYLVYGLIFINCQFLVLLFSQIFYSKDKYFDSEIKTVFVSFGIILCLVFQVSVFQIDPLVLGHVCGMGGAFLYMGFQLMSKKVICISFDGVSWVQISEWFDWIRTHFSLVVFIQLFSIGIPLITQFFLADFGSEMVSANKYSIQLFQLCMAMFIMPIIVPFYTLLSDEHSNQNATVIWARFFHVLKYILLISFGLIIMSILFSEWAIKVLFQRGAFDANSTYITSQLFMFYIVGIFAVAIQAILVRIYFIYSRTKFYACIVVFNQLFYFVVLFSLVSIFDSFIMIPITKLIVTLVSVLIGYSYLRKTLVD